MNTKYSVCIPVYNSERYLDQVIQSVLDQDYPNFELILVNDFSNDHSEEICLKYAESDSRIHYYKNQGNKGVLFTELAAISKTNGEYVLFLDNDDFYEKNLLSTLNKAIRSKCTEEPIDAVFYGARKLNESSVIKVYENEEAFYSKENREELLMKLVTNNTYNAWWRKAVRGSIIREIRIPDEYCDISRGNDKLFSAFLYQKCFNVLFIKDILYNWRDNFSGITRTNQISYSIDYRDKQETYNLIMNDPYVSRNGKNKYIEYQTKQFKAQLIRISCLPVDFFNKKDLFNMIKDTTFFNDVLMTAPDIKKYVEIRLFLNSHYRVLVFLCNAKSKLWNIIKKR